MMCWNWIDSSRKREALMISCPGPGIPSLRRCTAGPGQKIAKTTPCKVELAGIQHDVEHHQFRLGFHLSSRRQQLGDQQFGSSRGLQQAIRFVEGVAFKIHLGHESVLLAGNLEMDVCRSDHAGAHGICRGLDRLEPILTVVVGGQNGCPLKVWIERRGIRIAWMRVAPMSVRLPYFNLRVANRFSLQIEHTSHNGEDLTFSASWPTRYPR